MRKKIPIIPLLFLLMISFSLSTSLFSQKVLTREKYACRLLDRGEIEEALEILQQSVKTSPKNLNAHLYLGIALYLKKDTGSAFKKFEKIEKELNKVVGAGRSFGDEAMFTQMGMERRRDLLFSEELKGLLYFCRGLTLKVKKDLKNAEKKFNKAKKLKYDEKTLTLELIDLYLKMKNLKSASRKLAELKKITGENNILVFIEGYLQYKNNNIEAALAAYEKIETEVPEAKKNRGRIHYNKGEYQKAIEIWEELLSQKPDDKEAQLNLGRAYFQLGDAQKAQEYFDRAGVKISPAKYSPKIIPLIYDFPLAEKKFDLMCK